MTTPLSATSSRIANAAQSATGSPDLGRDEFLQLLVAQLRNQDPTSPQQGHEFAAQLAQFSTVEQLTTLNATVTAQGTQFAELGEALAAIQSGQGDLADRLSTRINLQAASGLVGQTVDVRDGRLSFDGERPLPVRVRLGGAAYEVEVTIRNEAGAVVRTIRTAGLAAGDHAIEWDGATTNGSAAPAGAYTAEVRAVGADGKATDAAPVSTGRVDRLTVEAGGVFLWVGNRPVPFDDLLGVGAGASAL